MSEDALEVFERLPREEIGYGGNARRIGERPHGSVARKVPGVEGRNGCGAGMHHVQRGTPGGGLRVVKQQILGFVHMEAMSEQCQKR